MQYLLQNYLLYKIMLQEARLNIVVTIWFNISANQTHLTLMKMAYIITVTS